MSHNSPYSEDRPRAADNGPDEPLCEQDDFDEDDNSGAVFGILLGALSGFLVGAIVSGQFMTTLLVILVASCSATGGWLARGLVR